MKAPDDGPARREVLLGALVIAAFVLAFLAHPIARLGDGCLSPADIGEVHSLTRVGDGSRPANELLSDPFVQFQPWAMFARDEIREGRIPLWNPWNGGGVPHLANFQSNVLSPFTVPFYVLPMALALVVSAFLKLFAIGFATFLFLRELRLVFLAAVGGGVVFAFAAHNVLFLQFPHSGTVALIPAACFLVERIARRFAARVRAREPAGAAWRAQFPAATAALAGVLTFGQLSGHPETLFFAGLFVATFAVARLVALWVDLRAFEGARTRLARLAVELAVAATAAVAAGSIQTLPFLEYVHYSAALAERSHAQMPLGLFAWPVQVFPNLLGNPSNRYYLESTFPRPDFLMATLVYVGATTLLAAACAVAFVRRRRAIAFFAAAWIGWFAFAYDLFGIQEIASRVPGLALAPINRSQVIPAFAVACLAAFTLHHVLDRKRARSWIPALGIALFAGLAFWIARDAALDVVDRTRLFLTDAAKRASLDANAPRHVAAIGWTFAFAVLCGAAAWLAPAGRARGALVCGVVAVCFAQCGFLFRNFTPVTDARQFFRTTPAIQALKEALGGRVLVIQGRDGLPPDTNLVHGIRQVASYDALGIDRFDRLYRACFGEGGNWRIVDRGSVRALQLFGAEALLERDGWVAMDTAFAFAAESPRALFSTGEIVPAGEIVQEFTGIQDGLDSIRLRFVATAPLPDGTVEVALEHGDTGAPIRTVRWTRGDMIGVGERALSAALRFEPIPDSRSRVFRLRIRSGDAGPGRGFELWMRQEWRDWIAQAIARAERRAFDGSFTHPDVQKWRLTRGGERLDGELYLDLGFAAHAFTAEGRIGPFTLHGSTRSIARFHGVERAIPARDAEESFARVLEPDFDPAREVVLEPGRAGPVAGERSSPKVASARIEIVAEEPGRIHLRAPAGSGAWLVAAQPWYPGWRATVDGVETEIRRANHAFSALPLPATACDVVLEYDPPVFWFACWLALTGAVLLAAWLRLSAAAPALSAAA